MCSGCQRPKSINEFALDKNRKDGTANYCRQCGRDSANSRYSRPTNAEKQFDRVLRFNYNMTAAQYYERLAAQRGVCGLCGKPPRADTRAKRLHVDHDHMREELTGEKYVRGLLCSECNHGLGKFMDDPAMMVKAANWVRRHRGLPDIPYPND